MLECKVLSVRAMKTRGSAV